MNRKQLKQVIDIQIPILTKLILLCLYLWRVQIIILIIGYIGKINYGFPSRYSKYSHKINNGQYYSFTLYSYIININDTDFYKIIVK